MNAKTARSTPAALLLALGIVVGGPARADAQAGQGPVPIGQGATTAVAKALSRHGIRPIKPPTPATDFRLPLLGGGEAALSDYQGRWVVLTFFATWCGPCRTEMPTLEKLHRQLAEEGDGGVAVLVVSIDSSRDPLDPYIRQGGFTMPVLWDERGQAARAYRATSIPLSYLVDPAGKLVGISRGSRDWAALEPMLDQLADAVPPGETDGVYAASGPVELPTTLDPPTAEVALDQTAPEAGEAFFLDIRMRWAGSFEEYLPHPPQVLLPEGVSQENVTASTSSREGRNLVTYRVALRAAEPGSYALDPVELRYTPRFEATPVASRVAGPTVEVQPVTIAGLRPAVLAGGAGGLAVTAILGWFLFARLKRHGEAGRSGADEDHEALKAAYDEARRKRLEGDVRGCFEILAGLSRQLDQRAGQAGDETSNEAADRALAEAVERARYGGQAPELAEIDSFQRRIERRLEELKPDRSSAARSAVRLRDEQVPQDG